MNFKIKYSKIYYYLVLIWSFLTILMHSSIAGSSKVVSSLLGILVLFIEAGLVIRYLITLNNIKIKRSAFLTGIFVLVCGALSYFFSGRDNFLLLALFVIAAKDTDIKQTAKYFFKGELTGFLFVVFCSATGIISNYSFVSIRDGAKVTRFYMGFSHANAFAALALELTALYIYINFDKIKCYQLIATLTFNVIIYFFAYSRTSLILAIVLFTYTLFHKYSKSLHIERIWSFITNHAAKLLLLIGICGSLFLVLFYLSTQKVPFSFINDTLFVRIRLISEAVATYSITLFGQAVNIVSSSTYALATEPAAVIDNAYIYCLLQFGITNTLIIIVGYIKSFAYAKKTRDLGFYICAIIFIILGFTEKYLIDLSYNFTLLMFGSVLYNTKNKEVFKIDKS